MKKQIALVLLVGLLGASCAAKVSRDEFAAYRVAQETRDRGQDDRIAYGEAQGSDHAIRLAAGEQIQKELREKLTGQHEQLTKVETGQAALTGRVDSQDKALLGLRSENRSLKQRTAGQEDVNSQAHPNLHREVIGPFAEDSAEPPAGQVESLSKRLKEDPKAIRVVAVQGSADPRRSKKFKDNGELSLTRAQKTAEALKTAGIPLDSAPVTGEGGSSRHGDHPDNRVVVILWEYI